MTGADTAALHTFLMSRLPRMMEALERCITNSDILRQATANNLGKKQKPKRKLSCISHYHETIDSDEFKEQNKNEKLIPSTSMQQ